MTERLKHTQTEASVWGKRRLQCPGLLEGPRPSSQGAEAPSIPIPPMGPPSPQLLGMSHREHFLLLGPWEGLA